MNQPITTAELVDLVTTDPGNPTGSGKVRGYRMFRSDVPGVADTLAKVPTRRAPKLERHIGRPVGVVPEGTERSRDLTPGEAAWISSLPTDPRQIDPKDATALAQVLAQVRSQGDRRLVASRLDPLNGYMNARQQLRDAEIALAAQPRDVDPTRSADWPAWREAIGQRIRCEVPELTQGEAELRAATLVAEAVAKKSTSAKRNELRAQIGDICRTHDIDADYFDGARRWGVAGDDNRAEFRADVLEDVA